MRGIPVRRQNTPEFEFERSLPAVAKYRVSSDILSKK